MKTILALLCVLPSLVFSQDFASLTIIVGDPTAASVPGARVSITDLQRGSVRLAETGDSGRADFNDLIPADYRIAIEKEGFNTYRVERMNLAVRARLELHVGLQLAATASASVDVVATIDALSNDPTQGTSVDHDFLANIPVNGRRVESLILMAPGMSSAQGGKDGGGFNANGLRSNMNYYTLDGVSVNQPSGGSSPGGGGGFPGGPGGGPPPGGPGGPGGGTTDLISMDSMQEMRVQTSSVAPEFGRTPGAQIVMTSRGGSNQFHGSLYDYIRNDRFDANDWFANAGGYGKGKERQNRPGGTLGGPIRKDRTLFFIAFEELRLMSPYTVIADVPDISTRASASPALAPFLNAFPVPNRGELTDGAALFETVVSNPTKSSNASARVDQIINSKTTAFARFSVAPTTSQSSGSDAVSPNMLTSRASRSYTFTAGLASALHHGFLNDLRLNYSDFSSHAKSIMDNFGGAIPLTDSEVFPAGVSNSNSVFNFNIMGLASYSYGGQSRNRQAQVNVVDSASKSWRGHQIKTGVDFRQTRSTNHPNVYSEGVSFNGLETTSDTPQFAFLTGQVLNAQVTSSVDVVYPTYINFSAYGQDTWRVTKWTTITYGLRWDVNPAPYARYGQQPFAISSDPFAGVTQNSPLYPTKWWNIAPRFGVAYNMQERRGHEMMLRFGIGVFYDVGYGTTAGAFNGAPFTDVRTLSTVTFPLAPSLLQAPALPPFRPYGQVNSADPTLVAPRVYQWNATWEHNYGANNTLTVGVIGSMGEDLTRTQTQPAYTSAYNLAILTSNGASSAYNGLQIQFRRRLSARLQTQLSYTWSHSIDSASNDFGGGFASIFGSGQRGSSDYDIRHNLSWSGSYQLPAGEGALSRVLFRNWFVDFNFFARTGLPFDLQAVSSCSSTSTSSSSSSTCTTSSTNAGLFALVRPTWNGEAIWIEDPHAPGGRRLNPNAFLLVSGYQQGSLGRNSLRGFGATQLDASLRRAIRAGERARLDISVQAYNVLNHPNFANPSPQEGANLASPEFGIATRMLNAGGIGGGNSLYSSGGPRSMELSIRVQF